MGAFIAANPMLDTLCVTALERRNDREMGQATDSYFGVSESTKEDRGIDAIQPEPKPSGQIVMEVATTKGQLWI